MARVLDKEDVKAINGLEYISSEQNGGLLITKRQDVSAILKQAKAERDAFPEHHGHYGRDMAKAAIIPNIVIEELMKKGIWQDKTRFKAWLNDPDNKAFRTSKGRV